MKSKQLKDTIFKYYWSGVYMGDIVFEDESIKFKNGEDKHFKEMNNEILMKNYLTQNFPFEKAQQRIKEINEIKDLNNQSSIILNKTCYSKYKSIQGLVNGKEQLSWIWAERNTNFPLDLVIIDNEIIGFIFTLRESCIVVVKSGYEELTPLREWQSSLLSKGNHGVKSIGKHMVAMRDGTELATEVWLPSNLEDKEKVPTILIRTPYNRLAFGYNELKYVKRGYALVSQNVRGRMDSDGEWVLFVNEKDDGDDTLNWIAEQPWSNGKVGMIGPSYCGFVQWAAAASSNPHLKAMVSLVTAGSPFVDMPRKGGTLLSGILAWAFLMKDKKMNVKDAIRDDWDEVLNIRPIKDIPKKVLGEEVEFWNEWMKHPDYDEFWEKSNWLIHGDKIDVPSLIVSGWYDDDSMGTTEACDLINKYKREHQKVILGPWGHSFNTTRAIHNIPFGDNCIRYDLDIMHLKWFDQYLKDIKNGIDETSPVEYYMVGSNEWKESTQWPLEEANDVKVYLHSNGNANGSLEDGSLKQELPSNSFDYDEYIYNPEDPAPHIIDMSENEIGLPDNYKEVEKREDVLTYTSDLLEEDVAIAGDINIVLYAASSGKDTDWVVRLTDVDEEGNSIVLSTGIIRARYRKSFKKPELLEPGKIEEYRIRMTKIANVFKQGHKIRLQVTSSADKLAFPNHNTGNNPYTDTEIVIANQKVYHNNNYPSHVILPIISRGTD